MNFSKVRLSPNVLAHLLLGLGFGLSAFLSVLHFSTYAGGGYASRFCSPTSGCHSALNSPFSSVIGVPVALIALFYMVVWFQFWRHRLRLLLVLAILGALVSAFYLSLFFFKKTATCPYCIAFHGVNLILLAVAYLNRARLTANLISKETLRQGLASAFGMLGFFIFSKTMMHEWLARAGATDAIEEMVPTPESVKAFLGAQAHFGTIQNAESSFVFFLDPSCDFCKAHLGAFEAYQNLAGKKDFSIVPFPREVNCAPLANQEIPREGACAAIALLDCLPKEHRFEFYRLLASDPFWKLVPPEMVRESFASYFQARKLSIETCNATQYRKEFADLLLLEENELMQVTPITYFRNQWWIGAFKVNDFARIERN